MRFVALMLSGTITVQTRLLVFYIFFLFFFPKNSKDADYILPVPTLTWRDSDDVIHVRCLTPVKATGMKFCEPKDKDACKSHGAGAICCPLIGQCVTVGAACTTTTAPEFMEEL